jgi:hypothetical protein
MAEGNGHGPIPPFDKDYVLSGYRNFYAATDPAPRAAPPKLSENSTRRWLGKEPKQIEWAISTLLPRRMTTLLTAEGGAGKTMLEQTWCAAIADQQNLFGLQVQPGSAAGFFAEDSADVLHARHQRICEHHRYDQEALADYCFIASYFGHNSLLWKDGYPTQLLLDIEQDLLTIEHLRLFAIDNAALVFGGEENNRTEVTQFMAYLNGLAERQDCAVVLSTHKSKSTDGSTLRSASGSTAWLNAARHVLELTPATAEAGPKLTCIKSNCIKPGDPIQLMWTESGVLAQVPPPDSIDERIINSKIDREILEAVRAGWAKGQPYSSSARSPDRYLPEMLSRSKGLKAGEVKNAMLTMLSTGVLVKAPRTRLHGEGLALGKDYEAEKSNERVTTSV